jgi:hypothetical protein
MGKTLQVFQEQDKPHVLNNIFKSYMVTMI